MKEFNKEFPVQLPPSVTAQINGRRVAISGPLGKVERDFSHASMQILQVNNEIIVQSIGLRKMEIALANTIASHIGNMIKGVTKGYTYRLKVAFSHFPITVKVQDDRVLIENFIGERRPRTAEIKGDCKVRVDGDEIIVQSIYIEHASQTAANIERATKIKNKDQRVFLDGIYVYKKQEGM